MPTKNAEKIAQAAVYIDGKPIKRIQEIELPEMKRKRETIINRLIKLIRFGICLSVFKLKDGRKGR